ncbi:MAG: [protein-PII] uridylyltransferase [Burkholderiaceae bacterium]
MTPSNAKNVQPPSDSSLVKKLRQQVKDSRSQNALGWQGQGNPSQLSQQLSQAIDGCVKQLWESTGLTDIALVAVGGYGRGELAPFSDIDLLILLPAASDAQQHEIPIASFVTGLWDIGLDAGHSVRDVDECILQAQNDLTVATALLESRLLAGPQDLLSTLQARWQSSIRLDWFVQGKKLELRQRHSRFQDSPYSLEPNIKESPGGLRDLQVIRWIATALGVGTSWKALEAKGLLTPEESKQLQQQQTVLLNLRAQLHLLANRREDRLVFDLQNRLAAQLGLEATKGRRASELLMQRYYRAAKVIYKVTAILLAELDAPACITGEGSSSQQEVAGKTPPKARKIDDYFYEDRGLLDIRDETIFKEDPSLLLKSFLVMQKESSHRGMTARTLRALWNNRELIDRKFREKPENKALFLEIFKQPRGIVHALRIMNDLGLLGRMLPVFRRIVGQMQHDLFHVYTVDQHILQVIRNLRRLHMHEHAHEFPLLTELVEEVPATWRLYLAALFHDIAKGRGGDHSDLGAKEVIRFCKSYELNQDDQDLLVFLVQEHLTMSSFAQKQDLADPDVIHRFVELVKTEERLKALYALTVSDIRGTSPKVWNAWKAKLLEELYQKSLALIQARGKGDFLQSAQTVLGQSTSNKREQAEQMLYQLGQAAEPARVFWRGLEASYFQRHSAAEIAWHARHLAYPVVAKQPRVFARLAPEQEGLQVAVYTNDSDELFARITAYFYQQNLPVLDARIHTTRTGYALDAFVLDHQAYPGHSREMLSLIEAGLPAWLASGCELPPVGQGRQSRQSRHFPVPASVTLAPDARQEFYILTIAATDRPGLLYAISRCLTQHQITIHAARVATLGERAEDLFLVRGAGLEREAFQVRLEADLLNAVGADQVLAA